MQLIIIRTDSDDVNQVIVPDDAEMEVLMQMVQAETGVPLQNQLLQVDGRDLGLGPLAPQGVVDGCALTLSVRQQSLRTGPHATPASSSARTTTTNDAAAGGGENASAAMAPTGSSGSGGRRSDNQFNLHNMTYAEFLNMNPEHVVELAKANATTMIQLKRMDSNEEGFGRALEEGDVGKVRMWMMKKMMGLHKVSYEKRQESIALAMADPLDPEVQRKIAEKIRMENVEESRYTAMENLPEAFASVTMLYVKIQINGVPVKAFVDSGAQVTIISKRLAEKCGVLRLVDERFAGQMRGVGTSMSLGRIHTCQMKFGSSFILFSATVMDGNDIDFLLGLDNLRRLRGVIDLQQNKLILDGHTASGREEEPFLGEADVPKNSFSGKDGDDKDAGGAAGDDGGGGKVGADAGASQGSGTASS